MPPEGILEPGVLQDKLDTEAADFLQVCHVLYGFL